MKKRTPSSLSDIGLIGLGVMGTNLARNIERHGFHVSVYNRHTEKTNTFIRNFGEANFTPASSTPAFVTSIRRPRKIILMVSAGKAVDAVVDTLLPYINKGDMIIDGGNSHYRDTQTRYATLKKGGIEFIGCGISGGEQGALNGPSLMPGASKQAWRNIQKILEAIAAKDAQGDPCVTHVGENGAGHYVKMVHNGIEYGMMQLMAEAYEVLRDGYRLSAPHIADIFASYGKGRLASFLFDIVVPILRKKDPLEQKTYLIDAILDTAASKGTGMWTSVDALERGVPLPTITQAVYARYLSAQKETRAALVTLGQTTKKITRPPKETFFRLLEGALYAGMASVLAQGIDLIERASKEEKWNIDIAEVIRIWQGGCIIRSAFLEPLHEEYKKKQYTNIHPFFLPLMQKIQQTDTKKLRVLVHDVATSGIAIPAFASSLFYMESASKEHTGANLIQGLRDYFGAHTYQRVDQPGIFHTQWENGERT